MSDYAKLCKVSFGLGLGVFWGVVLFGSGIMAMYTGYASGFVKNIGSLYIYYKATWPGCIFGAIFGFIDLFVAGYVVAFLYNMFSGRINKTDK